MAGVKGAGGPMPKRTDQRRGRNPRAIEPKSAIGAAEVPVPEASPEWHPIALRWYESLGLSGQSAFYEPSDWMTAWALAESMSREMKPQPLVVGREVQMHELPPKAASLTAWLKGMASLLTTEGDRRRAALELERPDSGEGGDGDVTWLDDARRRMGGAG